MGGHKDKEILEVLHKLHKLFKRKDLTLSVAESCTGGLLSHYFTAIPGSSMFFEMGFVTYSIESKKRVLGISSKTISNYGAVSEETAKEMAERARALTKTDYSVSTTGNLGPDVLEGREKGLVYIGVSREGEVFSKELRLRGDRETNKKEAAFLALKFLVEVVKS